MQEREYDKQGGINWSTKNEMHWELMYNVRWLTDTPIVVSSGMLFTTPEGERSLEESRVNNDSNSNWVS
uniref:Uncharacterized protein n=1 Tax=Oryza rufipogon TaxID=4529 RepID=A0A0E0PKH1_ORYRU